MMWLGLCPECVATEPEWGLYLDDFVEKQYGTVVMTFNSGAKGSRFNS